MVLLRAASIFYPMRSKRFIRLGSLLSVLGYLVVTTDDYHSFNTDSDDGSNLYVDGVLVVNNDGLHAAQLVSGVRHLQDTVHSFELDFFQALDNKS